MSNSKYKMYEDSSSILAKYMLEHGLEHDLRDKPFLSFGENTVANHNINESLNHLSINVFDNDDSLRKSYSKGLTLNCSGKLNSLGELNIKSLGKYHITPDIDSFKIIASHDLVWLAHYFGITGNAFSNADLQRHLLNDESIKTKIDDILKRFNKAKVDLEFSAIISSGSINSIDELLTIFASTTLPIYIGTCESKNSKSVIGNLQDFGFEVGEELAGALVRYTNQNDITYDEKTDNITQTKIKLITRRKRHH